MEQTIRKYALQNALFHGGKAQQGAVIGKVLQEHPEQKANVKELAPQVGKIVAEVNALSLEDQKAELAGLAPELMEKKKGEKKSLPELRNVDGKVTTRIPPEPSKYLHLGHALSFLINQMYAEKYDGTAIVRLEDTNPEKSTQEYVEEVIKDLTYLGITQKPTYVSDDMPNMLKYADQLIDQHDAYICSCDRETSSKLRKAGQACEHRNRTVEQNTKEWKDMQSGNVPEGAMVLRFKGNMESNNHAMRDPAIWRITKTKHYKQGNKYNVWPLYDFENAVEDASTGVTHVLRSIEFGEMRVELQNAIKKALDLPLQEFTQYGRFMVKDALTKGREIRELIQSGEIQSWDDPRLMTIRALQRRGIQPEAFRELAVEVGLSKTPTTLDFSLIAAVNRKIVDATANRYFFVKDPEEVIITGAPKQSLLLKEHPGKETRSRSFDTDNEYLVEKDAITDELIRLMDCINVKKESEVIRFDSIEHEKFKDAGSKTIVWLPKNAKNIPVEILMPDATKIKGFAEEHIRNEDIGNVVQFVKFGFCKLEEKADIYRFIFSHE